MQYMLLHCAVPYCAVLCYAMLYMLLYCAVLYCTILYCAVLCYVCYYTVLCYAMLYMLLYCAILRYFNRWYSVMNKHLLTSVLSRERVENCAGFWTKPLPLYYEPRLDPLSLVKKYCVENKRILFSQCTLPLYKNDWGRLTGRARVGIPLKCLIPPPRKWVGGAATGSQIKNSYPLETCDSCGINPLNPNVFLCRQV